MSAKLLWQIGGFLAVVVILALGWFLLVSPSLDAVADNRDQTDQVAAKNAQIRADIANLSKVDVAALKTDLAVRIAQIPEVLVEEDIYQEIKTAVATAGITPTNISITPPEAFATTQTSAEGTDPSAAVTPGTPITAPGLPITAADLETASKAGLYVSTVTISVNGSFAKTRHLIDVLTQQLPRTFLVTSAALNGAGGDQTISALIWYKPRTDDLLNDPDLATPDDETTSEPTPAPESTSSPVPTSTSTADATG